MISRAYDTASKERRRQVILEAAATLFDGASRDLPSVADIAASAGLGKGTIYLYFGTKEEIFAALLLERWKPALTLLATELSRADKPPHVRIEQFILRFVDYVAASPALLRLDALGKETLETNMGKEALAAHKQAFLERINELGAAMEQALELPAGRGFALLTRTHAMTRGLWQSFGDPVLDTKHGLPVQPIFATELREALLEYWRGALPDLWPVR